MVVKIKTRKLSDGTLQLGYHNGQGWVGVCNLYRKKGGWESDNYAGWEETITKWKDRVQLVVMLERKGA